MPEWQQHLHGPPRPQLEYDLSSPGRNLLKNKFMPVGWNSSPNKEISEINFIKLSIFTRKLDPRRGRLHRKLQLQHKQTPSGAAPGPNKATRARQPLSNGFTQLYSRGVPILMSHMQFRGLSEHTPALPCHHEMSQFGRIHLSCEIYVTWCGAQKKWFYG